jgi:hypothetical protein
MEGAALKIFELLLSENVIIEWTFEMGEICSQMIDWEFMGVS